MSESKSRTAVSDGPVRYRPTHEEVEALIGAARRHPLGLEFLRNGALDSVCALFGVHAFVVDSARSRFDKGF